MRILSKIGKLVSLSFYKRLPDRIITSSPWYKNIFEDAFRIKKIPQHLDIINVGSNPAKFGLDYSRDKLKGYNLAVGPQTLTYDYRMLKNYHSYLDDNGPRLLLLFPFSLCKDKYTEYDGDVCHNLRYYPILHPAMIDKYDASLYEKWVRHPHKLGLKAYYNVLRYFRKNKLMEYDFNPMNEAQMENSARQMIDAWQREFFISDLNPSSISKEVESSLEYNSKVMDDIILFCQEREIDPTIVLPPLSPALNNLIPDDFRERCIYSVILGKNIKLLDYTRDGRFCKNEYFVDALKLNKKGRILFTSQVISDLKV